MFTAGIPPVDYNLHVNPDGELVSCKTHPYYKHISDKVSFISLAN